MFRNNYHRIICLLLAITSIGSLHAQNEGSFYNFGGHAFAGSYPIDNGFAYLYKTEADLLIPIDTAAIDTLGYYYFYNIEEGKYVIKVGLSEQSNNFVNYLPTYYGNKLLWSDAEVIDLLDHGWEYDISLKSAHHSHLAGDGEIMGTVYHSDRDNSPASEVELILMDNSLNTLYCIYSDQNGNFSFDDLEVGTYNVYPEVTGLDAAPKKIVLTASEPVVDDLNIYILKTGIVFGIHEEPIVSNTAKLYPNPTIADLILEFEMNESTEVNIHIYDHFGKLVFKEAQYRSKGSHKITLNTRTLSQGVYSLQVSTINTFGFNRKFVKID